jgi:outer membrane protein OmpA-like peptidoglycan-associated protein
MRATKLATILATGVVLSACAQVNKGVRQVGDQIMGRSAAVTAPVCQDFTFPLYFQTGSDQVTPEGLQVIDNNVARVRACPVAELKVTGLADAQGDAATNLALSQRRATSVGQVLAARGYPAPTFELAAAGATGATAPRGRAEPMRRRAEVSVRFAAPTPTVPMR